MFWNQFFDEEGHEVSKQAILGISFASVTELLTNGFIFGSWFGAQFTTAGKVVLGTSLKLWKWENKAHLFMSLDEAEREMGDRSQKCIRL